MLTKIKLSQFGGMNTVVDSSNQGVTEARLCRNFLLRPLGALGVPPAWTTFAPGDVTVSLGFLTNIDYRFDSGSALYFQSPDANWWDCSVLPDGTQRNVPVAWAGATLSADLVLTSGQVLVWKFSSILAWRLAAAQRNAGEYTERSPLPPYVTTTYTSVRAFTTGFGITMPDSEGNTWRFRATDDTGFSAITI